MTEEMNGRTGGKKRGTEYVYCLITPEGKRRKGSISAGTREEARRKLKEGGNVVIMLESSGILER